MKTEKVAEFDIISESTMRHTFYADHTLATHTVSDELGEIALYDMLGNVIQTGNYKRICKHGKARHASEVIGFLGVMANSEKCVAMSCSRNNTIGLYNLSTQNISLVYAGSSEMDPMPGEMCLSANNTIIALERSSAYCSVAEFNFAGNSQGLSRMIKLPCNDIAQAVHCAETEEGPVIYTCYMGDHSVLASDLNTGHKKWHVTGNGQLYGKKWKPMGLCYGNGRLYVAEAWEGIIVLDAGTGSLIQTIALPKKGKVCAIAWSNEQPHLAVMQDFNEFLRVTYFNIHLPIMHIMQACRGVDSWPVNAVQQLSGPPRSSKMPHVRQLEATRNSLAHTSGHNNMNPHVFN